jgi:hypothetical protein
MEWNLEEYLELLTEEERKNFFYGYQLGNLNQLIPRYQPQSRQ